MRLKQFGPRGLAVVTVVIAASVGWAIGGREGAGLAFAFATPLVFMVLAVHLRVKRRLAVLEQRFLERVDEADREARSMMAKLTTTLEATGRDLEKGLSNVERQLEKGLSDVERQLEKAVRRLDSQPRLFGHLVAEIDALIQVQRRIPLSDPAPLTGGWALAPRTVLELIDVIDEIEPSLVVECGSGSSTIYMARALEIVGGGRLVALEHDEAYAERTRALLDRHDLSKIAEVRHAPLAAAQIDDEDASWYATDAIADLDGIDLVLVDGPPADSGADARYPAYPLLRDRLSARAVLIVDDVERQEERHTVERWLSAGHLARELSNSPGHARLRVIS